MLQTRAEPQPGTNERRRVVQQSLQLAPGAARSIAERRAKQSPMKDVAGMVRSYGYAAYAALFAFTTHTPDRDASCTPGRRPGGTGRRTRF